MSELAGVSPPADLGLVPSSVPLEVSVGLVPVGASLVPGSISSPGSSSGVSVSLGVSLEGARAPTPCGHVETSSLFLVDPVIQGVDGPGSYPHPVAFRIDAFDHEVELSWLPDRGSSSCPVFGDGSSLLARRPETEAAALSLPRPYPRPPLYPVRSPRSLHPVRLQSPAVPSQAGFDFSVSSFPPLSKSEGNSNSHMTASPVSSVPLPAAPDMAAPSAGLASWASLVKDNLADMKLSYIKPSVQSIDGRLRCSLPPAVASSGAAAWENTLVGFFLDKLPFSLVNSQAHRLWDAKGLSEVLSNDNGFFFFKFRDKDSSLDILHGGPWHFGGRPIFLKAWRQGLNLSKDGCKRVPIWVHFRNVPLEFWTAEGLSHIASIVGIPLHADKMTASLKRLSFARICVEIGIDDSLPNSLDLVLADGSFAEILIDYSWVPKKCSICKNFGHLPKNCKKRAHHAWVPKASPCPSSLFPGGVPSHQPCSGTDVPVVSALPGPGSVKSLLTRGACGPCSSSAAPFSSGSEEGGSCVLNAFAPLHDLVEAQIKKGEGPTSIQASAVQPSACVEACSSPIHMDDPDDRLSMDASPIGSEALSSPLSSSSTPLLARRLKLVDELEKKQGKKIKHKKQGRSAGSSKGKILSDFG